MADQDRYETIYLPKARELVNSIEKGEVADIEALLSELTSIHETEIYRELGKLTRELHNAITSFRLDSRISALAETDIPDAKARLNCVITMTDQAAHKTLSAIEEAVPICEKIHESTADVSDKWNRFIARDLTADQFRDLVKEISSFMAQASDEAGTLKARLNDILIAQDFQDLTGQALRRVIQLVQDVEENLVGFIKMSSKGTFQEKDSGAVPPVRGGTGPQLPGMEDEDALKTQDEVDDLLSSLGF